MKQILSFSVAIAALAVLTILNNSTALAQTGSNQLGKGAMQQWGPFDDDGDGIPNGLDPDYVKPNDGTGHQFGKLNGRAKWMYGKGFGYGPGMGLGNQGIGPRNGSGYGPGTGTCDGTGPKGKGRGGRG